MTFVGQNLLLSTKVCMLQTAPHTNAAQMYKQWQAKKLKITAPVSHLPLNLKCGSHDHLESNNGKPETTEKGIRHVMV